MRKRTLIYPGGNRGKCNLQKQYEKEVKYYMKKGFTIIEVSILLVIFLIVAFLVVPLSLDDTKQANNTSRWRGVQSEFENVFYSLNTQKNSDDFDFKQAFMSVMLGEIKGDVKPYKITFLNGTFPNSTYRFSDYKSTYANSVLSVKFFDAPQDDILGLLMYDVNGTSGPNVWGKDVFGFNIYSDRFEPFCKSEPVNVQKQECSKDGTGLCCSNYYLIGGSFE